MDLFPPMTSYAYNYFTIKFYLNLFQSKVLGDEILRTIAQELVGTVGQNVTIDWTVRRTVRAKLKTMVNRILRKYDGFVKSPSVRLRRKAFYETIALMTFYEIIKYGYPPDKQEKATQTILKQAELLGKDWK